MIRKFCRWILSRELALERAEYYMKGWKDGVNQQLHEPKTCEDDHLTSAEYWGYYDA